MNKLLLFIVGIVIAGFGFAGEVEKVFIIGEHSNKTKGDYYLLEFNNSSLYGKVGEPALPYYSIQLLLPVGEKAVSIEFEGFDEETITIAKQIYPYQASRPMSDKSVMDFKKNTDLYKQNISYPEIATGQLITQYLNGYSFALSSFTPVKYNPEEGTVTIYHKVKIKILTESCEESELASEKIVGSDLTIKRVAEFAQNPEMLSKYPIVYKRSNDYDVLIITDSQYENQYGDLLDLYQKFGLSSEIVTTTTIDSESTGADLQEKIRNYIIQEYQNHNISYVLLGGDTELVPHRGFYAFVDSGDGYEEEAMPADLYYSALDGDWNTDGDNRWGEPGEEDFLPEVAVGRFPFSNADELENMIHKTISYQINPVLGELDKSLFAGEWLLDDPISYGSDYLELLIGHVNENGYETWGIPETHTFNKMYAKETYWEAPQLLDAINSGAPFIHHSGHADYNYWAFLYLEDITNANFPDVDGVNHNYSVVQTHGCVCGAFDYDDCIMERMVSIDNFAVACIANSRFGWFNEGQTEGPAVHLHREMLDALFHEGLYHIGDAFVESKIQTAPWVTAPGQWEEGALRWNFYDINILGDPVLALYTNEPFDLDVSYENQIEIDASSTNINIEIDDLPAESITCVLIMNGITYGQGVTNSEGNLIMTFSQPFSSVGEAVLVVSGNNCTPTEYPVSIVLEASLPMEIEDEISVYPSLADDFIMVSIPEALNCSELNIYNSVGQIVFSKSLQEESSWINLNGLASGKYYIEIRKDIALQKVSFVKK